MHYFAIHLSIIALTLINSALFAQDEPVDDREAKSQKPTYVVWETPHDLTVYLSSASDRIDAANLIVLSAANADELTNDQRMDGFFVAGTTLLRERSFHDAESAYQHALQFADEPVERAHAHNGLASAYIKDGSGMQDPRVLAQFKAAADEYLIAYPDGQDFAMRQLFRKLFAQADITGKLDETYSYGQAAAGFYAPPGDTQNGGGEFLYNAIHHAEAAGDNQAAVDYIDQLLVDYPNFMLHQKLSGALPYLIVKREILLGSTWDSMTRGHIQAVSDIMADPRFDDSIPRYNYGSKLASYYADRGLYDTARALREQLVTDIEQARAAIPDTLANRTLRRGLLYQKLVTLYQDASTAFLYENDPQRALNLAMQVAQADQEEFPNMPREAQNLIDEINEP